jgi:hypothetical protein
MLTPCRRAKRQELRPENCSTTRELLWPSEEVAIGKLRLRDFQHDGEQHMLRFQQKGAKSREIPARLELQRDIVSYLEAAGIGGDAKDRPLFRSTVRKTKQLAANTITGKAICEMVNSSSCLTRLGQDHHHGKCCLHLL